MGYTAGTFSAGEQPTTAKWNLLWANDASFNDGTGIANNAIVSRLLGLSSGFTGGLSSQANAGTAGGTMYYINLGGIKVLWALGTSSQSSDAVGTNQPTFTLPTSFFSTIQGAVASPAACTNSAAQSTPIIAKSTTTITVACVANSGSSTTQQPSIIVWGT